MVADPLQRVVTLDEYLALPDDADYEVIRGRLYVAPRPYVQHQHLMMELGHVLRERVVANGGRVLQVVIDADLILNERNTYLSPDLMYFAPETVGHLKKLRGRIRVSELCPTLVIEIVSDNTDRRDIVEKAAEYAAVGIPHFWLFGSRERECRELILNEKTGAYEVVTEQIGGRITPRLFANDDPPLILDLDALDG